VINLLDIFWWIMEIVQLDFFKTAEESEIEALRKQIAAVKASSDKVRRGMFARHGDLTKIVLDLQERLAVIERNICRGK
jgi:hypothetical protein